MALPWVAENRWTRGETVEEFVTLLGDPRFFSNEIQIPTLDVRPNNYWCFIWNASERLQGLTPKNFLPLVSPYKSFFLAENWMFLPPKARPDQARAKEHGKECMRLQSTSAGKKARELLFSFLNERQKQTYLTHNFFTQSLYYPTYTREEKEMWDECRKSLSAKEVEDITGVPASVMEGPWGPSPGKYMFRFKFYTQWPNGNVVLLNSEGDVVAHCCFHPDDPYPMDDILLTQLLMIRESPYEFLRQANVTTANPEYEARIKHVEEKVRYPH